MEQHSGNSLYAIDSVVYYTFEFVHIASSAGINKVITQENDCLPYMCCSTLLVSGIRGSRTTAAFKTELSVTKVIG